MLALVNLIPLDWEAHAHVATTVWEPAEDPVEDCTRRDVGWMMVEFRDVLVGMYCYMRECHSCELEYRRPPMVPHA